MRFTPLLIAALACACGTDQPEVSPSIEQGIYGYALTDFDSTRNRYSGHADVTITANGETGVLVSTRTLDEGYFELAIEPGRHQICIIGDQCTDYSSIGAGVWRWDFDGRWHPEGLD